MSDFKILQASEVSWQDYRDLRLEALKKEPQAYRTTYESQKERTDEEWQQWLKRYQEGNDNWMMFASNGYKLVGMMGAYQTDREKNENSAWIIAAYISSESRGKGVGKLLMNSLLNELMKTSIKKVKLEVNIDQIPALTLYKSCGFQIVKKENYLLGDGKYHDEYLMEKTIQS